ncbi:MAG: lysine--tRNA ligase [Candidatus Marinimicrobia bacterium]|nr:lysine--tRNA ligase [Candidatus Neomarinimicrobiota bacterium]
MNKEIDLSTNTSEGKSLQEIRNVRIEKVKKIKELGFNPYDYKFERTHKAADVIDNYEELKEEVTVKIAGRLMAIRKMGKANFCDIKDDQNEIQIYIQKNKLDEEQYELFKLLDIGDIIGVSGKVMKSRTGEITIFVEQLDILTKSIRPIPIVKESDDKTYDAFHDKELRYRKRYLDLIVNPDVKEVFKTRSKIISWTREFLDNNDYIEVETPILQPLYGGANARPFKTYYNALSSEFYLRIADELYLKRLIIGGFDRVYELSKNFRNEGVDRNHNPEFTLLEFYQTYVDYEYMMDFVENFFKFMADKLDKKKFEFNGNEIRLDQDFKRSSMFDLIEQYTGENISDADATQLKTICASKGMEITENDHYGNYIEYLFDEFVEPNLIQPTFVTDLPKAISPLAKLKRDGSKNIVERFELFIGQQEFVNAFSELNDPLDQRERMEKQKRLGESGDKEAQTLDEDFLEALEYGMPPTGGVGIGIDRLVMLLTNQNSIRDVLLFPQMRQ